MEYERRKRPVDVRAALLVGMSIFLRWREGGQRENFSPSRTLLYSTSRTCMESYNLHLLLLSHSQLGSQLIGRGAYL